MITASLLLWVSSRPDREQGYVAVMAVFPSFSTYRHPVAECALSTVLDVPVPELYEISLSEGHTLAQIMLRTKS